MDDFEPDLVSPFVLGGARIDGGETEREEWEDEDSFGNPGTTCLERVTAVAHSELPGEEVAKRYRESGFGELPVDSHREDDRVRFQRSLTDPSNPFLHEHVVQVGVRWRDLLPAHRCALEKKVASLREEAAGARKEKRRARALKMLKELEAGLLTSIHVESSRRLFRMAPVFANGGRLGRVVSLGRMDQLVYTVVTREHEGEAEEKAGEPMYITILGTDDIRASFLFSGGIVGQRLITDLEEGVAHNAWFQNRQSVITEDTAPWISRKLYRDLREKGEGDIVVRWGRDDGSIRIRRTGQGSLPLKTPGGEKAVPVLIAETSEKDRLWILKDEENPLVIRMEESGAGEGLLRAVEEVRTLTVF